MNIYIRHVDQSDSVHLCDVAIDKLDTALSILKRTPIFVQEMEGPYKYDECQFIVDHDECYLEVIVS